MRNDKAHYIDLDGQPWDLGVLDPEERRLFEVLRRAAVRLDWNDFDNFRLAKMTALYKPRGLSGREIINKALFRIGQDLSSRIAVSKGYALYGDYRDDLEELIKTRFKSRRAFCKVTGLSEAMLSHVLAGRKDLSIQTLTRALHKIGYGIRMVPLEETPSPQKTRKAKAS